MVWPFAIQNKKIIEAGDNFFDERRGMLDNWEKSKQRVIKR